VKAQALVGFAAEGAAAVKVATRVVEKAVA